MVDPSDSFDDSKQQVRPGMVIKCFIKNTHPPKHKRIVVIGIDDSGIVVGSVFINSNINWNVIRSFELAKLQLFVRKEDNDYLDWDSYIDCSELIELSHEEIVTGIRKYPKNVLGNVSDENYKTIIDFIKDSPKITPKMLKKYRILGGN